MQGVVDGRDLFLVTFTAGPKRVHEHVRVELFARRHRLVTVVWRGKNLEVDFDPLWVRHVRESAKPAANVLISIRGEIATRGRHVQ